MCSASSGLDGGDESEGGVGSCAAWSGAESPAATAAEELPGEVMTGIPSTEERDDRDDRDDAVGGGEARRVRFALGPSYDTSSSISHSPCLSRPADVVEMGTAADAVGVAAAVDDGADPVANGLLAAAAGPVDQYGGTSS